MTERIRYVDRSKAKDYLKRAEECANAMRAAYQKREWNACVINAVHCAVSSADALLRPRKRSAACRRKPQ